MNAQSTDRALRIRLYLNQREWDLVVKVCTAIRGDYFESLWDLIPRKTGLSGEAGSGTAIVPINLAKSVIVAIDRYINGLAASEFITDYAVSLISEMRLLRTAILAATVKPQDLRS